MKEKITYIILAILLCLCCNVSLRYLLISFHQQNFLINSSRIAIELDKRLVQNKVAGAVKALSHSSLPVKNVLSGKTRPDEAVVLNQLSKIKKNFNASIVYAMDLTGTVKACSPYGENNLKTLTGKNYSFRPYFRSALKKEEVLYPAIGVTTHKRGLYYSAPVQGSDSDIIGVIVIKMGLESIDGYLSKYTDPVVLVSPEGVVFSTNISDWLFEKISYTNNLNNKNNKMNKQFDNIKLKDISSIVSIDFSDNYASVNNQKYAISINRLDLIDEKGHWNLIVFGNTKNWYPLMLIFGCTIFVLGIYTLIVLNLIRKKENLKMEQHRKELVASNKIKTDFLGNMSHELRTPLNNIKLLSGILEKNTAGNLSDNQIKSAGVIQNNCIVLIRIVEDILEFSKNEGKEIELIKEEIELSKIMSMVDESHITTMSDKGLKFDVIIEDKLPQHIITDRFRLMQIINNLISNSIKFTEKGSIEINIHRPTNKFMFASKKNKMFCISVIDTGTGIPFEKKEMVFEAFKQADTSISRNYGGTGLGLAICKQTGKILGGDVVLESTSEGEGSCFTIYLPEK